MIVLVVMMSLLACSDDEAAARQTLAGYEHLVLVERADGGFDFSGANAGRCSGTVWVAGPEEGVREKCVRMSRELPPSSLMQPLAVECDAGDPERCVALAEQLWMSFDSNGTFSTLTELYAYGCDRGVAAGCTGLGLERVSGDNPRFGEADQIGEALHYFEMGCAGGDLAGCEHKADMRWSGIAPAGPDPTGALAEIATLCFGGRPSSCEKVSSAVRDGSVAEFPQSAIGAEAIDMLACARGADEQCARLLIHQVSAGAWNRGRSVKVAA